MKRLKILIVNSIIFSIFILFTELLFGQEYRGKYGEHTFQFKHHIPRLVCGRNLRYDASKIYKSEKPIIIKYERDKDCYRSFSRNNFQKLILTIGGSTTDQRFVSEGESFQDILDSNYNGKYDFINAGVDAQSTFGHLVSIKEWHSKALSSFKVNKVIFYVGANDTGFVNEDTYLESYKKKGKYTTARRLRDYLNNNSFIYNRLKNAFISKKINTNSFIPAAHGAKVDLLKEGKKYQISLPRKDIIDKYSNMISSLIYETQNAFPGVQIIFIYQQIPGCRFLNESVVYNRFPEKDLPSASYCKDLGKVYLALNKILKDIPNKFNVSVLPMFLSNSISDDGVYDIMHTNRLGSNQIANYILKNLE